MALLIALVRLQARLPLRWLRALGAAFGLLLWLLARRRREVVLTNLRLCFAAWDETRRHAVAREVFVRYAQSWFDRGWLWHAPPEVLRQRLRLTGALDALAGDAPTVVFAPHFFGLDAGWTALTLTSPRRWHTIFTDQSDPAVDAWVFAGRARFGEPSLFRRFDGVKPVVRALREGRPLYLLPDMNFGPSESIFVPFYGIDAATVPSLSRFARLAGARVVPVITRMDDQGYVVEVMPPWTDVPGDDAQADTALMNRRLQDWIDTMPAQYFWVHQRFKTRPPGQPPVYRR